MKKYFTRVLLLSVILVLGLTIGIAYAQGIGGLGLGDTPTDGLETQYMFTGVYSKVNDQKYATVIHCTNIGSQTANVKVEFFPNVGGFPVTLNTNIASSQTKSFATRTVAGWSVIVPVDNIDIQSHGSGWVRATQGSELICTAQLLTLNTSNVPTDITRLHLYDDQGNLIR